MGSNGSLFSRYGCFQTPLRSCYCLWYCCVRHCTLKFLLYRGMLKVYFSFYFFQNFDKWNFQFYFKNESLIFWEIFWGVLCLSSSKIDEFRIFSNDFLRFFSLCHWSLCEVAKAKLLALETSLGYQMKAKHHSFYMRCWLLL